MSVVGQLHALFVLLTLVLVTDAKSISIQESTPHGDATTQTIHSFTPEVLVFLELLKDSGIRSIRNSDSQSHLFLVVQPDDHRPGKEDLTATSDPNILLMVEHFQSQDWPATGNSARLTRGSDSSEPPYLETGTSRGNFYDLWLVPRRNSRSGEALPSSLVPPPLQSAATSDKQVATESGQKNINKVSGRSISSSHMSHNSGSSDEDTPDFLSTLVTIPQVWMHDLSHMIIQPLRKPSSGERDSYEYFGMVGKAPFIQCPLGFKKSSLGNSLFLINFSSVVCLVYWHFPYHKIRYLSSGIPEP